MSSLLTCRSPLRLLGQVSSRNAVGIARFETADDPEYVSQLVRVETDRGWAYRWQPDATGAKGQPSMAGAPGAPAASRAMAAGDGSGAVAPSRLFTSVVSGGGAKTVRLAGHSSFGVVTAAAEPSNEQEAVTQAADEAVVEEDKDESAMAEPFAFLTSQLRASLCSQLRENEAAASGGFKGDGGMQFTHLVMQFEKRLASECLSPNVLRAMKDTSGWPVKLNAVARAAGQPKLSRLLTSSAAPGGLSCLELFTRSHDNQMMVRLGPVELQRLEGGGVSGGGRTASTPSRLRSLLLLLTAEGRRLAEACELGSPVTVADVERRAAADAVALATAKGATTSPPYAALASSGRSRRERRTAAVAARASSVSHQHEQHQRRAPSPPPSPSLIQTHDVSTATTPTLPTAKVAARTTPTCRTPTAAVAVGESATSPVAASAPVTAKAATKATTFMQGPSTPTTQRVLFGDMATAEMMADAAAEADPAAEAKAAADAEVEAEVAAEATAEATAAAEATKATTEAVGPMPPLLLEQEGEDGSEEEELVVTEEEEAAAAAEMVMDMAKWIDHPFGDEQSPARPFAFLRRFESLACLSGGDACCAGDRIAMAIECDDSDDGDFNEGAGEGHCIKEISEQGVEMGGDASGAPDTRQMQAAFERVEQESFLHDPAFHTPSSPAPSEPSATLPSAPQSTQPSTPELPPPTPTPPSRLTPPPLPFGGALLAPSASTWAPPSALQIAMAALVADSSAQLLRTFDRDQRLNSPISLVAPSPSATPIMFGRHHFDELVPPPAVDSAEGESGEGKSGSESAGVEAAHRPPRYISLLWSALSHAATEIKSPADGSRVVGPEVARPAHSRGKLAQPPQGDWRSHSTYSAPSLGSGGRCIAERSSYASFGSSTGPYIPPVRPGPRTVEVAMLSAFKRGPTASWRRSAPVHHI